LLADFKLLKPAVHVFISLLKHFRVVSLCGKLLLPLLCLEGERGLALILVEDHCLLDDDLIHVDGVYHSIEEGQIVLEALDLQAHVGLNDLLLDCIGVGVLGCLIVKRGKIIHHF